MHYYSLAMHHVKLCLSSYVMSNVVFFSRSILLKLSTLCIYVAVLYSEVKCITNVNNKACDKVSILHQSCPRINVIVEEFLH